MSTARAHAAPDRLSDDAPVFNPATGAEVGRMPLASRADLDRAVLAARAAYPGWRATPYARRQELVAAFGARVAEHADDLARLLTAEQGKPLADAMSEVAGAAYWMGAFAARELPVTVLSETEERRVEQRRLPLGVVAAIAPWNFPVFLALWKVAPALLAGNTLLLKPSPFTPLTTLRIAELVEGLLPPGVCTVITGGDELGPWITAHPGIDKISFTGSTATGRKVMESASATLKRVTLELGGNDAAIVLPDADLDTVVPDLFWGAFRNSGQICLATKRLYVHDAIYDRFRDALVAYAATVEVGDGAQDGVQLGPVQNEPQYRRVLSLIDDCRRRGLTFAAGGSDEAPSGRGLFVPITIIDNPPDDARVVTEEAFGPVLPLLRFSDVDEAVSRANDSPFGLTGSVWSRDAQAARAVAERLEAGIVWVNETQALTPDMPFGGRKQSGFGVENGLDGLLEYTASQVVSVRKAPGAPVEVAPVG